MSALVGLDGRSLRKEPPVGFYVAGICPTCKAPIFHHGEVRMFVKQGDGTQAVEHLEPAVYPTCLCHYGQDVEIELSVPAEYNPVAERKSIEMLIGRTMGLMQAYINAVVPEQEQPQA